MDANYKPVVQVMGGNFLRLFRQICGWAGRGLDSLENQCFRWVKEEAPMTRVRSLEGREAGVAARIIQFLLRMNVGKEIKPVKVQAHSTRMMVGNFVANAIMGTGRTTVGNDIRELAKSNRPLRVDPNGFCPLPIPEVKD